MRRSGGTPAAPSALRRLVLAGVLLASLVAGVGTGVTITRGVVVSPSWAAGVVLEADTLYEFGLHALTLDIANSDFLAGLNLGPLQVTQEEVSRILHATYDESDVAAKGQEVHAGLLEFFRDYPEAEMFRVSIEAERPILADSLGIVLLAQYAELPDCGIGQDLGSLFDAVRVRFFGRDGDTFYNEDHPDCRPPDMVAERVEEGIEEAIEEMITSGPDSIDAFPEEEDREAFATLVSGLNRALLATHPAWFLALFGIVLGIHWTLAPAQQAGRTVTAFGVGMALWGGVALFHLPGRIFMAFEGAGTPGEASELWGQLGSYAFRRVAELSGGASLLLGLALAASGVVMGLVLGRRAAPAAGANRSR